ncbi:hypothetical protein M427DRAFT_68600 [Gonapodya prolifera JEL478]|uniref:Cytochrome b5 heme-binding domain-containing protein n=1 Tax=Gonapodya prolifera (strain JEL478) TaxID=1344416 RepID=A0A139AK90_GONPJ|nr:hypothetical protein M427DRAFT_68600 [Gonapodya prolifera JEL478]|eukprot:KXS17187.1 hypothetical protein M427DRAFT_68600 [Gonapodya prolifera JEL478]
MDYIEADLNDLNSVDKAATTFLAKGLPIHMLILNAGIMMLPNNHFAHFLLTERLLPVIEQTALAGQPVRVVGVSSRANTWAPKEGIITDKINDEKVYNPESRYGETKLANIVTMKELQRRLEEKHGKGVRIYCNSLHPGGVATELVQYSYPPLLVGVLAAVSKIQLMLTPEQGAISSVYLATSPDVVMENIRGQFYWDQARTSRLSKVHAKVGDEAFRKRVWEWTEGALKEKMHSHRRFARHSYHGPASSPSSSYDCSGSGSGSGSWGAFFSSLFSHSPDSHADNKSDAGSDKTSVFSGVSAQTKCTSSSSVATRSSLESARTAANSSPTGISRPSSPISVTSSGTASMGSPMGKVRELTLDTPSAVLATSAPTTATAILVPARASSTSPTPKPTPPPLRKISQDELAQHANANARDVWIAYRGVVYDISGFLHKHPGGLNELLRGAGRDATQLIYDAHPWINIERLLGEHTVVGVLERQFGGVGGLLVPRLFR